MIIQSILLFYDYSEFHEPGPLIWGFYIVCVVELCSEVCVAKRYHFWYNFWDREGRSKNKLHPI